MNWLDILLCVILCLSMIASARRGFSREVIGLAAAFFSVVFGMWFYGTAGSLVQPYVSSQETANLIGFILVVAGVLICGALLGWLVSRLIRTVGLSFFDRALGAIFGLARGLFIAVALLMAYTAFGPWSHEPDATVTPSAMVNSRIAPYVLEASRVFVAAAPMELKASFRKQYNRVKSAWENRVPDGRD